MRRLATVRRIDELLSIPGADLIKAAEIDGWTVVVKKDEFQVGDLCVYFEIDSFLPDGDPRWQHLVDKSSKTFEGAKGHRLKTIKLRGQLSQGFAVPVDKFFDDFVDSDEDEGQELSEFFFVGNDLTDFLNIKKWEAVIPSELAGQVKGNFPSFIPKTDQERCQNISKEIFEDNKDSRYEITMKLDGTSFTGYVFDEQDGVCSRNWELQVDDEKNANNSLVRMYVDSGLQAALREIGVNYGVQGELMGPGIQKNREGLNSTKLFVFAIYDINGGCYLPPRERHQVMTELYKLGLNPDFVDHAPVYRLDVSLAELPSPDWPGRKGIFDIEGLLSYAEGPSLNHAVREGFVFKRMDGGFCFKVISNKFLLKEDD